MIRASPSPVSPHQNRHGNKEEYEEVASGHDQERNIEMPCCDADYCRSSPEQNRWDPKLHPKSPAPSGRCLCRHSEVLPVRGFSTHMELSVFG